MQPKNSPERKKAFFSFLLLFMISAAIIILLAFSSVQVPLKQNNLLTDQMEAADKERAFSKKFLYKLTEITSMLDSINKKAIKPEILDGQITESITKLTLSVNADSVYNKELYRNVVTNLSDLQTALKALRSVTNKDDEINKLQKANEGLQSQLDQCNNRINDYIIKSASPK